MSEIRYTKASFQIEVNKPEHVATILNMHKNLEALSSDTDLVGPLGFDLQVDTGVHIGRTTTTLWAHGIHLNLDNTIEFLKWALRLMDTDRHIEFQYSLDSDKPSLNAYGGGYVWVTRNEYEITRTSDFVALSVEKD